MNTEQLIRKHEALIEMLRDIQIAEDSAKDSAKQSADLIDIDADLSVQWMKMSDEYTALAKRAWDAYNKAEGLK